LGLVFPTTNPEGAEAPNSARRKRKRAGKTRR
jgi:hypothetical protein